MKTTKLGLSTLGIALATAGLFAFKAFEPGSIKGTVSPAEGATRAWALSSTDTLRTDVTGGTFEIKGAKAGTYRVIIEAASPYKNAAKDNVTVADGQAVDVGTIVLEK